MQIAAQKVVSIHYTLKNDAGRKLDSSEGGEPLTYLHGMGMLVAGLENALEGKPVGEKLSVTVPPAEGYGERSEELTRKVPRGSFDADDLQIGMRFRADMGGQQMVFTVINVEPDGVTIDGNHALAGETLHFDVEVTDIRDATPEELDHGHVHGPGGHHHH